MSDAEQLDRQGYLTISKGGVEAKIVPESLPAWKDQGWSLVTTADPPADDKKEEGA